MRLSFFFVLASTCMATAEVIVITVGGNGSTTFVPQRVVATLGDVVIFSFATGNHTATESTFSSPCIPAHETNVTINGFDSGFRNTLPRTSGSILTVPIIPQNQYQTFWFFDYNTCGEGGVGVINNNESSSETVAGFSRNAIRLNGTNSSGTTTSYLTHPTIPPLPSAGTHKSAANRFYPVGVVGTVPLFVASLFV